MNRALKAALLALLVSLTLGAPALALGSVPAPGQGCMGTCHAAAPKAGVGPPSSRLAIPDVSEYQPCVSSTHAAVIRLYEAGTGRQDAQARCNAARLRAGHRWFGGYAFLRPGSCTAQADATVAIVRAIGGIEGPIIADAEVPLPRGFVSCYTNRVRHDAPRYPTATYTSCGTVSEVVRPLWVADYEVSLAHVCSPFGDPFLAWQYSEGALCGERFATDCSLDFGITALRRSTRPSAATVGYWRAERAQLLHRIIDECSGARGPRCHAWTVREHRLWLDIRQAQS